MADSPLERLIGALGVRRRASTADPWAADATTFEWIEDGRASSLERADGRVGPTRGWVGELADADAGRHRLRRLDRARSPQLYADDRGVFRIYRRTLTR